MICKEEKGVSNLTGAIMLIIICLSVSYASSKFFMGVDETLNGHKGEFINTNKDLQVRQFQNGSIQFEVYNSKTVNIKVYQDGEYVESIYGKSEVIDE